MDLKDFIYNSLSYLNDSKFNIKFKRESFYIVRNDRDFFEWKDVCDELEPLLRILHNRGLLDYIDHINYKFYFDDNNYDYILNGLSKINNFLYIDIYLLYD